MTRRLIMFLLAVLLAHWVFKVDEPTAERKPVEHVWTVKDSKSYARDALYHWANKQYICLSKLWGKESAWNPKAYNKNKVMGKNAGGIPQLLGLSPKTPAPIQIDRGLAYIKYRYTTPCRAWSHHKQKGWY